MFVSLVLCAVAGQAAPATPATVMVVVSRNLGASVPVVAGLKKQLQLRLAEEGVPTVGDERGSALLKPHGQKPAQACDARRPCLVELARKLPVDVLISLSITYVKPDLSVVAEAVRASDGKLLAELSEILDKDDPPTKLSVSTFAQGLRAALAPPPPPVAVLVPEVTDAPIVAPPQAIVPVVTRPSAAPAVITGVAAVAALGAGVALGVSGGSAGASLAGREGPGLSSLSYNEALAKQTEANTQVGVAVGCAVGAAVLGVVTYLLWPTEAKP